MKCEVGSTENIRRLFACASPMEVQAGLAYWTQTHVRMLTYANTFGCSVDVAAGVFAVLSPNNDEAGNYRDMHAMLQWSIDQTQPLPTVQTYTTNRTKAIDIISGVDPLLSITGRKTRAYFHHCCRPYDPHPVCVDGHMVSVWLGRRVLLKSREASLSSTRYAMIADDIRQAAKKEGVLPCQMQAVCWLVWKRLHKIRYDPQLRLWQ